MTHRRPFMLLLAIPLLCATTLAADECHVVLFGDSTVITGYTAKKDRIEAYLGAMLRKAYPKQKIRVSNVAQGGDYLAKFLTGGRYQRDALSKFKNIDIAIVRYGQNDWKRMGTAAYAQWQEQFYDTLLADYPGVTIVPESGMWFNPKYMGKANKRAEKYWAQTAAIAKKRNTPFSDVYAAMARAAASGNWDLAIRRDKTLDASKDHLHKNDPTWFRNGHPNPAGNLIAAQSQFAAIRAKYPVALPTTGGVRKGDGSKSVCETMLPKPDIRVLLHAKGVVKSEVAGRFRKTVAIADTYRTGTLVRCTVSAPAAVKIQGSVSLDTTARKRTFPLQLTRVSKGEFAARVWTESYGLGLKGYVIEFKSPVTVRDLRVENIVFDPPYETNLTKRLQRKKKPKK